MERKPFPVGVEMQRHVNKCRGTACVPRLLNVYLTEPETGRLAAVGSAWPVAVFVPVTDSVVDMLAE